MITRPRGRPRGSTRPKLDAGAKPGAPVRTGTPPAVRTAQYRVRKAEREAAERAMLARAIRTLRYIAHGVGSLKQAQEAAEWALLDHAG